MSEEQDNHDLSWEDLVQGYGFQPTNVLLNTDGELVEAGEQREMDSLQKEHNGKMEKEDES